MLIIFIFMGEKGGKLTLYSTPILDPISHPFANEVDVNVGWFWVCSQVFFLGSLAVGFAKGKNKEPVLVGY